MTYYGGNLYGVKAMCGTHCAFFMWSTCPKCGKTIRMSLDLRQIVLTGRTPGSVHITCPRCGCELRIEGIVMDTAKGDVEL